MEEFSEEGAATKIRKDPPPVDDPPPSSTAKKLCLRNDEDDSEDDDDNWTSPSISEKSSSSDMTEKIKQGITDSQRCGDGYVEEVGDLSGLIISCHDTSPPKQAILKLNFTITDTDYPEKPKPAAAAAAAKKNPNLKPSEQNNVPKLTNLHSSFQKSGFFNSSTMVANKLTPDEWDKFNNLDQPLIPITPEMINVRDKLALHSWKREEIVTISDRCQKHL